MSTETPAAANPLTELVNALKAAFQPTPVPPSASGSPMAMPATFAGEAAECSGFLLQVNLFIQMQPQMFLSENANAIITHRTTTGSLSTSDQLFRIQQGTSSVTEYTLQFRTLAAGWNETALLGAYRQGLNSDIRAAMALYDDSIGLESFLQRTTRVAQRLAACQPLITAPQLASVAASSPTPTPRGELLLLLSYLLWLIRQLYLPRLFKPTSTFPSSTFTNTGSDNHSGQTTGAQLPKGRVYPLSIPERQAMEEYITEALSKKDGGLRPCIDYCQLNSQIKQQPYPLPLVPAALEEPRGAQVFTKLDLRSAYNLVRIRAGDECPSVFQTFINEVFREFLHQFVVVYIDDILIYSRNLAEHRQHVQQVLHKLRDHSLYLELEKCEFHRPSVQFLGYIITAEGVQMDQGKVSAIQEWPQPLTVKELQRFLGFSNFYRRFIKDYSTIMAPLTSLLRGKPKALNWNPSAREAFQRLKEIFSTAPLLYHPDPELPFTVEVDASTTGVGAVLSQAVGEPPLLHPCAFYSRKLSSAEQNYDVSNRELLAIKLALEEWRHWLEGSTHPFTIITDHKNLQYLREARRLNPRQARWALFFTRFNFKITYRPGSKNVSADALARQFSADHPAEPEPIIPSNLNPPAPSSGSRTTTSGKPPSRSPLRRNAQKVKSLFLNPNDSPFWAQLTSLRALDTQVANRPSRSFKPVTGGPVCAVIPSGKLVPLPIPQRPWSHIGVDFVTDLPGSEGNTCVLVMVDRFSKMCKFLPLRGFPTAMETAELLFQQLFRHFGLPKEIVSDRDQWPDREKDPRAGTLPLGILSRGPAQLEQVPPVGRVRTELSAPRYHRLNTLPVRTRLPALPQAESPLCWSVQDPEADQRCHIPASAPSQKPRELKRNLLFQKSWTNPPSTRFTRSWIRGVKGATWNRLGGIRTRGTVLGTQR
ncbi:hypothetical protein M9458_050520 [Cirrhinus mrigala]|uniref:ribonuclease H n=1 Tax=Cirrhinus mrigala TaxID=683832 RepID=A0ABD0N1H2_CIRMR